MVVVENYDRMARTQIVNGNDKRQSEKGNALAIFAEDFLPRKEANIIFLSLNLWPENVEIQKN